ncbi:RHS repeat domain-containing protein [Terriglobus albidus]|uniref:RHS repeat domain-containing protein n=1 Tax=Terriglobus albidus TaxID=1592106 RepID=UPI0021DF6A03|nr:RHS repeat-associated core domain-containing protein [Terriglobus albidus]
MNVLKTLRLHSRICANLLLLGLFNALLTTHCVAQPGVGLPKFAPIQQQQIDNVDLATLNIHLDLPIFRKNQRGTVAEVGWHLTYDSNAYPTPGLGSWNQPGWHLQQQNQRSPGTLLYSSSADPCPYPYEGYSFTYSDYILIDTNNTYHSFNNLTTTDSRDCGGTATSATGSSPDGAYTITVAQGLLVSSVDPSGMTTLNGGPPIDTNGNILSFAPVAPSSSTDNTGAVLTYQASYFPNASTSSETFGYTDSNGNSQSVQTTYQQVTILAYNPTTHNGGNPIAGPWATSVPVKITYPDGTYYAFTYEPTPNHPGYVTGRLASVRLPTGGLISYTYFGGAGNYGYIDDALGTQTTAGLIRTTSDGATTYTRTAFSGSPWQAPNPYTVASTLIHDQQGNETIVDSNFGFTQYYETRRRVYSGAATGTPLSTINRCYNGTTGDCTAVSTISMPITSIDLQTSLNGGSPSRTIQTYNANGLPTDLVEYDYGASNPTRHTIINYAALGNNILDRQSSVTVQDGAGSQISQTTYEYDRYSLASTSPGLLGRQAVSGDRGNRTTVHRWVNTTGTTIDTYYHYDDAGQVVSSTDGRGNTTNFSYDPGTDSCLNSTTLPTPSSGVPQSFTQGCDANTNLVTSSTDPNGTITTYGYDSMLRLRSTTAKSGGNTVASTTVDLSGGTLPETITTTVKATPNPDQISITTLDPYGRTSSAVSKDGATVLTTYDSLGRVSSVTNPYFSLSDPSYGVTGYSYDALNRMTMQCQPDNGSGTIVPCVAGNSYKQWSYSSNTVTERDEQNNSWQRTMDAFGHVAGVVEPGNLQTSYSYSGLGDLTNVTQYGVTGEAARTRSFVYDSLSRLITGTNAETGTTCYGTWSGGNCVNGYDGNGNLLALTDGTGFTVNYQYDALNRKTFESVNDPFTTHSYAHSFVYDLASIPGVATSINPKGRLVYVGTFWQGPPLINSYGVFYWNHDALGRVLATKTCTPLTCSSTNNASSGWYDQTYSYDLAGDLTSYSDGFGTTITQNYDSGGRISSVTSSLVNATHPSTLWTANSYSPIGITQATLGNGIVTSRQYTNRTWLQSNTAANQSNQSLYSEGLSYYHNGNPQTASDSINGNWTYQYDNLNRLSTAVASNIGVGCQFGYDSFGNRKQEAPYQGSCFSPTFSFSAGNNQIDGYCYDGAGRLLDTMGCPPAGSHHQFIYDGYGNLLSGNYNSTNSTSYTVDAYGRRVAKYYGGQLQRIYLYDIDGNPVSEMDGSGNWLQMNVRVNGQFLAEYKGNDTYFIHVDHLGSVRAQSSSNGTQTESCSNFPFGDGLTCSASSAGYHFTGKERDPESGLDYFGARYFGSTMGRFISPDWASRPEAVPYSSLANPQTLNLYAYLGNNPLTGVDPDGHTPLDCTGDNVNGIGCQMMAQWNIQHEVSSGAWAASGFGSVTVSYENGIYTAQQQVTTTSGTSGRDLTHFASVSFWPTGAGGFGHIGIQVDSDDTQGFSTQDPTLHWWQRLFGAPAARTEDDIAQHTKNGDVAPHSYLHIPISADQAAAMQAAMAARTADPGHYNLFFNNCAQFVESVLHAGGVRGIPHGEIFGPPILFGALWYANSWR